MVDSDNVAAWLAGRASADREGLDTRTALERALDVCECLSLRLDCRPRSFAFANWQPPERNKAADALANFAMDARASFFWAAPELDAHEGGDLVICSDAGFRAKTAIAGRGALVASLQPRRVLLATSAFDP